MHFSGWKKGPTTNMLPAHATVDQFMLQEAAANSAAKAAAENPEFAAALRRQQER